MSHWHALHVTDDTFVGCSGHSVIKLCHPRKFEPLSSNMCAYVGAAMTIFWVGCNDHYYYAITVCHVRRLQSWMFEQYMCTCFLLRAPSYGQLHHVNVHLLNCRARRKVACAGSWIPAAPRLTKRHYDTRPKKLGPETNRSGQTLQPERPDPPTTPQGKTIRDTTTSISGAGVEKHVSQDAVNFQLRKACMML